jgi:hypothetical protein
MASYWDQMDKVTSLLADGLEILGDKQHDYAVDEDAFYAFKFIGDILSKAQGVGLRGTHLSFLALLCVKLGRVITLLAQDKEPKNEALRDTFVDMANYAALWGGYALTDGKETVCQSSES